MKKSGIYLITNIINWKRYVGKDSDLPHRWMRHKRELNSGIHENSHLQNSWNKYGEHAFIYSIIRYCRPEDLVEYEQFYMDLYDCVRNGTRGYNKKDADGTNVSEESKARMAAWEKTPEHRANLSAALVGNQRALGHKQTEEHKAKVSAAQKGKKLSEETKAKMRKPKSHKGNPLPPRSEEHCAKLSAAHIGKTHSEETKAKMSADRKGIVFSLERNAKISAALTGKPKSPEHCAKVSAGKMGKPWSEARREAYNRGKEK